MSPGRVGFLLGWLMIAACAEPSKVSERKAVVHVERLAKLAGDDVEELRRGMPRGAKALGPIWTGKSDPHADPGSVAAGSRPGAQRERDLEVSKGTFFAVTDDKGIALRSDQEPDQLAAKSFVVAYPGLTKVLAGNRPSYAVRWQKPPARERAATSNGSSPHPFATTTAPFAGCT